MPSDVPTISLYHRHFNHGMASAPYSTFPLTPSHPFLPSSSFGQEDPRPKTPNSAHSRPDRLCRSNRTDYRFSLLSMQSWTALNPTKLISNRLSDCSIPLQTVQKQIVVSPTGQQVYTDLPRSALPFEQGRTVGSRVCTRRPRNSRYRRVCNRSTVYLNKLSIDVWS